ncbi:hypothetical protein AVEN_188083-1, partial [Araneus ventricosus]
MDRTPPHGTILQPLQQPHQLDGHGTLAKNINTTEYPRTRSQDGSLSVGW